MTLPPPRNEPVRDYAPGSPERSSLAAALHGLAAERPELPLIIGGEEVRTGRLAEVRIPHAHQEVLATWHAVDRPLIERAIAAAEAARPEWTAMSLEQRAGVFLRAADLLAGPWRDRINAATMLGQSKTVHQAEIDAAAELIDFWRFNPWFAARLEEEQPVSPPGSWNRLEYRPLEGFVFAVTPFNFTSIAGNLPTAPALMGNTVIWKPAAVTMAVAVEIMRLLQAAGLPDGVINLVGGNARDIAEVVLAHESFAGLHFTGSTEVFQSLWRTAGANVARYRSYPRLVGETGGKDFIVAHASADVDGLATAIVRGAFEYQGQKCSAASRLYLPDNLWPEVRDRVGEMVSRIRVGDVTDFGNFMGAVIDEASYRKLSEAIEIARRSPEAEILIGGGADDSEGWFIEPTLVETTDPHFDLMERELFGPVVTAYVYPASRYAETLDLADGTSPYALTGAVFARDRGAIELASERLRFAAGNFYVNDKPTGAVVGQQPFGGGRASGTNDKAGSPLNLTRWVSARSIKETFVPPVDFAYPFMEDPARSVEGVQEGAI
jgi:1-pyrroline-5-carboxylate dehydrogenase